MFGAAQKGNEACGGIKEDTSLGLRLVVPSTATGNTEEAEALAERKGKQCQGGAVRPVACAHPRGDDQGAWMCGLGTRKCDVMSNADLGIILHCPSKYLLSTYYTVALNKMLIKLIS